MPKYKGQLEQSVELAVFQTRLATALNTLRKRKRFKMKDVAQRVGVSNTYMTKIMRGQANISLSLLYCFCRELDVPVTDLIGTWADHSAEEATESALNKDGHHSPADNSVARG